MMPIHIQPAVTYSFPDYQRACNNAGFRVWEDQDGSNQYPGGKSIYDVWGANLGGHDCMSYKFGYTVNGQSESSHSGGMMVSRAQMAAQLHELGLSNGQHVMCMKTAHSGGTSSSDNGACTTFQLSTGSVSSASFSNHRPTYDLAFCACMIGQDCPAFFN